MKKFASETEVEAASAEADQLLHALKQMCKLTDDWDSAGASAPATEIVADAREF